MRVAFDARSLTAPALRGWDRYTVGLVDALARAGVEPLLLHQAGAPPRPQHLEGVAAEPIAVRGRRGLFWEQLAIPRALARLGVDLYHAPAEHGVPLATGRPVVLTIHSATAHSYADLVQRGDLPGTPADYVDGADPDRWSVASVYWRLQVRRADHVVTPSAFAQSEVVRFLGVPSARVTVTPLAVDARLRRPPRPPDTRGAVLAAHGVRRPFILYVGGYERHKNVEGTLAAAAIVRRTRPEISLVAAGTKGVPPALPEAARRLGLEPGRDVTFLVDVTDELADLYDEADAFLSLSWRESFGLPALEALARGVPVVVSGWGAAAEVVGDAGTLVDPRDPAGAAGAVLALLGSGDRARLADRARRQAARFSWEDTAQRTLAVYRALGVAG